MNRAGGALPAQLTIRYWYIADGLTSSSNYQELMLDYAKWSPHERAHHDGDVRRRHAATAECRYVLKSIKDRLIGPGQMTVDKTFPKTSRSRLRRWPVQPQARPDQRLPYAAKTAYGIGRR